VGTIIEFVHRLTSGAVMLMAVGLWVLARRTFPAGHPARRWAFITLIFMLIEAAVGAGIVLLRLVEDNASALRAGYVGGLSKGFILGLIAGERAAAEQGKGA